MDRLPVVSSNLVSVGYDIDVRILEIEFKENRVYQYFEVPEEIFNGLMSAGSKGQYHHQFIKNNFTYQQTQ